MKYYATIFLVIFLISCSSNGTDLCGNKEILNQVKSVANEHYTIGGMHWIHKDYDVKNITISNVEKSKNGCKANLSIYNLDPKMKNYEREIIWNIKYKNGRDVLHVDNL